MGWRYSLLEKLRCWNIVILDSDDGCIGKHCEMEQVVQRNFDIYKKKCGNVNSRVQVGKEASMYKVRVQPPQTFEPERNHIVVTCSYSQTSSSPYAYGCHGVGKKINPSTDQKPDENANAVSRESAIGVSPPNSIACPSCWQKTFDGSVSLDSRCFG